MTMRVGVAKEIKPNEGRVALTPRAVRKLTSQHVHVAVEAGAGLIAGFRDTDYVKAGAIIRPTHEALFHDAQLIVKVKEPQPIEYPLITPDHTLFTFFHFAGVPGLLEAMLKSKATCIAYETMQASDGSYPILAPMSKIAGEEAVTQGMRWLSHEIDLKDVKVTIIGAGVVGTAAAETAKRNQFGEIIILDNNIRRLKELSNRGFTTYLATPQNVANSLAQSHLAVGAAYITGKAAPKLVTRPMLESMPEGSIFVDVSIDQGGITEESVPTTISNPVHMYKHVKLYCVANMPGRVPERATNALSEAVLPFVERMAIHGIDNALSMSSELQRGLSTKAGVKMNAIL